MWKAFFQHELSRYTEENFVVVNNKSVSFQLKMESEQFPGKSIIQIPYERDSFTHSEGKIDISQVKGFSSGVKKLMEEIVQYGE